MAIIGDCSFTEFLEDGIGEFSAKIDDARIVCIRVSCVTVCIIPKRTEHVGFVGSSDSWCQGTVLAIEPDPVDRLYRQGNDEAVHSDILVIWIYHITRLEVFEHRIAVVGAVVMEAYSEGEHICKAHRPSEEVDAVLTEKIGNFDIMHKLQLKLDRKIKGNGAEPIVKGKGITE